MRGSVEREREMGRGWYSHDAPGHHADDNHKGPAGHQADTVEHVADRLVRAQFRELAVKRIEPAVVQDPLLVLLPRVQRHHVPGRRVRHVEVVDVDRARRRRLVGAGHGPLDVPECRRLRHPGRAEGALRVAVYVGEARRRGVGGQEGGRLVPFPLQPLAVPAARLVAAGDENHPFLRRF